MPSSQPAGLVRPPDQRTSELALICSTVHLVDQMASEPVESPASATFLRSLVRDADQSKTQAIS